jgi:HAD superfamily hydrolase (TIGR01509 family)
MSFELLIFDCDGVLVDSEPLVNRIYVDMLREDGLVVDEADMLRRFSGAAESTRLAALKQELGWVPRADFATEYRDHQAKLMGSELVQIRGISALLEDLRIPICVASNGAGEDIRIRLGLAGLSHFFGDALFSAEDLGRPKPLPDIYLHAARHFDVEPARCAVIEDSLPGVQAARAAGMTVFGYAALTPADQLAAAGALPFFAMEEIPALLARAAR